MQKIEDVYFIVKNNAPQPHTIIENPTFYKNGYRITHYSMGANTSAAPVRYHHLAVYSCSVGEIHIQVYEAHQPAKEIVLRPGDYWLRPARTLCGWYAKEDTVFTIISMRYTANLSPQAEIGGTCTIKELEDVQDNTLDKLRIVDDEFFKLDFLQIGKNYQYALDEKCDAFFTVIKGDSLCTYHNKTYHLNPEEAFHTYGDEKVEITTENGCKALQLIYK